MLSIKVLGPGCSNCQKVEAAAKSAVANMGVEAEIVKVTDYGQIMSYNILSTPGLVINEKLVAAGRIPQDTEVMTWIADAMSAN
ncbi:MAG: TM0996/MTH895 family glutaredoxin-like protein [Anaerolineae bacterium]|nr:TM0996/MTH895 family glutaredoxin-like protein [Anaerolineae bacterium]